MSLLMVRKSAPAHAADAAEKEDPKHPSIAEAKKVLAQFDAQDSGDYGTNANALMKMALGNLLNASRVARRVIDNIGSAMSKVKDNGTKDSLNWMQRRWGEFLGEIDDMINKISRLPTPPGLGIPHKEKIPPEERAILKAFFE